MKINILFVFLIILTGCSSEPRNRWTDKNMRVMIDPESLEVKDYVRLQASLVTSQKWAVIDRAKAFNAIKKEQEMLHRNDLDRFADKEKWSHWGQLYGVGGIVVANVQCVLTSSMWYGNKSMESCNQFLSLVDANTGEVIVAVEDNQTVQQSERPNWKDLVEKFNKKYPENYEFKPFDKKIVEYKAESEEAAIRQKEEAAKKMINSKGE